MRITRKALVLSLTHRYVSRFAVCRLRVVFGPAKELIVELRQPIFSISLPYGNSRAIRRPFLSLPSTATVMASLDGVNGTVCNAEQYQRSLSSYNNPSSSISCLTHGQTIGLAVSICHLFILFLNSWSHVQLTAEASLISFICVVAVFIHIAVRLTLFYVFIPFDDVE